MGPHISGDARDQTRQVLDSIRRIVQLLRESSHEAEARGLTGAQLFVLRTAADSPGLSVGALAERTRTHQSSVSVVVARLVEQGLLERTRPLTTAGGRKSGSRPTACIASGALRPPRRNGSWLPSTRCRRQAAAGSRRCSTRSCRNWPSATRTPRCSSRTQRNGRGKRGSPMSDAHRGPVAALDHLGDFTTSTRVLPIAALAAVIGVVAAYVAAGLLALIGFFTNLFFFQRAGDRARFAGGPSPRSVRHRWCR